MNSWFRDAVISAPAEMAGAAPTTWGIWRRRAASA
jgi:hypothetical protein